MALSPLNLGLLRWTGGKSIQSFFKSWAFRRFLGPTRVPQFPWMINESIHVNFRHALGVYGKS
jgi:hypothetical protein